MSHIYIVLIVKKRGGFTLSQNRKKDKCAQLLVLILIYGGALTISLLSIIPLHNSVLT